MKEYWLSPPKYFVGQKCEFEGHKGGHFIDGKIVCVSTNYTQNHVGYHVYQIMRPYDVRARHLAEDKIKLAWW